MAINLNALMGYSPCLYHVTFQESLDRVRKGGRLESAATLMKAGGQCRLLRSRRDKIETFRVESDTIRLTDQGPLNQNCMCFQGGWTLADLVEAINQRVFFWRGTREGLLRSNQGHSEKYSNLGHDLAFLRLRFQEVITLNSKRGPELCKYNSGAARMNQGRPSPRGPSTFVAPHSADFTIGAVQEIVFRDFVELPRTTEICSGSWRGPWSPLFSK